MNIKKITEGPMMANCYVIYDENKNGFLIDPVYPGGKIENYIDKNKINIEFILLTHTHFDHVLGLEYFKNKFSLEDSIEEIMNDWNTMAYNYYTNDIKLKPGALQYLLKLLLN